MKNIIKKSVLVVVLMVGLVSTTTSALADGAKILRPLNKLSYTPGQPSLNLDNTLAAKKVAVTKSTGKNLVEKAGLYKLFFKFGENGLKEYFNKVEKKDQFQTALNYFVKITVGKIQEGSNDYKMSEEVKEVFDNLMLKTNTKELLTGL